MTKPNRSQWCVIWITALTAAYVWLANPYNAIAVAPWPIYRVNRNRFTLVILVLGTILTWGLNSVDIIAVLQRIARDRSTGIARTILIAAVSLSLSGVAVAALLGQFGDLFPFKQFREPDSSPPPHRETDFSTLGPVQMFLQQREAAGWGQREPPCIPSVKSSCDKEANPLPPGKVRNRTLAEDYCNVPHREGVQ